MGDAATPVLPDFTSQTAAVYKANIDAGFAAADRQAWAFAPHEQSTPDMTVRLEAGAIFDGAALTGVAAQSTGTIAAPTTDPRIDRVVVNRATGAVSVIAGAEDASPTAPAITGDVVPVCQVALVVSQSTILNADITDERALGLVGLGAMATKATVATGDIDNDAVTLAKLAHGTSGKAIGFDGGGAPAEVEAGSSAASQSEMEAAGSNTVMATPSTLKWSPSAAKAWIHFDGTGTIAIDEDYNVTGITDNGLGDYTVTWATDFSNATYCCVTSGVFGSVATQGPAVTAYAAGSIQVLTASNTTAPDDWDVVCVAAFGDQA